ncbi:uncharacterized protein G2W53_009035 [Senna tora]|uniref:Uncharacterized protein n=1 Tax=Senna tora TaxID=362788 RepID=A0A835C788_9FABA|nr:uncharacterized protein G2W53_009035 [Senna tora]
MEPPVGPTPHSLISFMVPPLSSPRSPPSSYAFISIHQTTCTPLLISSLHPSNPTLSNHSHTTSSLNLNQSTPKPKPPFI